MCSMYAVVAEDERLVEETGAVLEQAVAWVIGRSLCRDSLLPRRLTQGEVHLLLA